MTIAPVRDPLADLLTDDKPLDRTTVNSWEDIEFVQAGGRPISWVSLAVELLAEGREDWYWCTTPSMNRADVPST